MEEARNRVRVEMAEGSNKNFGKAKAKAKAVGITQSRQKRRVKPIGSSTNSRKGGDRSTITQVLTGCNLFRGSTCGSERDRNDDGVDKTDSGSDLGIDKAYLINVPDLTDNDDEEVAEVRKKYKEFLRQRKTKKKKAFGVGSGVDGPSKNPKRVDNKGLCDVQIGIDTCFFLAKITVIQMMMKKY